jgi:hypothetical protein
MFADVRGGLRRGIDASSADRGPMRTAVQRVHDDRSRYGRGNPWRLAYGGCVNFEWLHRPSSMGHSFARRVLE